MKDNELFEKFENYFTERGWTFEQAAQNIGVGRTTLFNWKGGKKISAKGRKAINTLLTEINTEPPSARILTAAECHGVPVPLLTNAQAAQISPSATATPDPEFGTMVTFANSTDGDFAMTVAGNSMTPWYPPGTRLLVKRNILPKTGNRVAAMLADRSEPIFKNYVDLGGKFVLLSINERDGLPPIFLDKMEKGDTWYWCYPIGESVRDEFALDEEMKKAGIEHFWEKWLEEYKKGE